MENNTEIRLKKPQDYKLTETKAQWKQKLKRKLKIKTN